MLVRGKKSTWINSKEGGGKHINKAYTNFIEERDFLSCICKSVCEIIHWKLYTCRYIYIYMYVVVLWLILHSDYKIGLIFKKVSI